jgi:hypothetical protein
MESMTVSDGIAERRCIEFAEHIHERITTIFIPQPHGIRIIRHTMKMTRRRLTIELSRIRVPAHARSVSSERERAGFGRTLMNAPRSKSWPAEKGHYGFPQRINYPFAAMRSWPQHSLDQYSRSPGTEFLTPLASPPGNIKALD